MSSSSSSSAISTSWPSPANCPGAGVFAGESLTCAIFSSLEPSCMRAASLPRGRAITSPSLSMSSSLVSAISTFAACPLIAFSSNDFFTRSLASPDSSWIPPCIRAASRPRGRTTSSSSSSPEAYAAGLSTDFGKGEICRGSCGFLAVVLDVSSSESLSTVASNFLSLD